MRRLAAVLAGLLLAAPAVAERLPFRAYTIANGLAHDHVRCILPDSRGLLWLGTVGGLSRFDGRRFANYGAAHGLGEPYLNDVIEAAGGALWVASNGGGVYRFDPVASRFTRHPVGHGTASNRVNTIVEDAAGALWAGTDDGLFVRAAGDDAFQRLALPDADSPVQVHRIAAAPGGALWIAASAGLFRAERQERIVRILPHLREFHGVMADRGGRVWAAQAAGLVVLSAAGEPAATEGLRALEPSRFTGWAARIMLQRRVDGHLLLGGRNEHGLVEWDGSRRREYGSEQGLGDTTVTALAEDTAGNLWIGTETAGVMRLARNGFVTFGLADGLGHRRVVSMFETRLGELCVQTAMRFLNRFDGRRFTALRPILSVPPSFLFTHSMLQDHAGNWWAATSGGLARYPRADGLDALARSAPIALHGRRDGLGSDDTGRPFEDVHGDIWVTVGGARVARWERATGAFHLYTEADGLPPANAPMSFGEDRRGALWLGFREGGLARRVGERFEFHGQSVGVPAAMSRSLHLDARGRLWVATTGGGLVQVLSSPEGPRFVRYTTADGLSTDHIRCLTDDGRGRLYLGTAVGVDRFDPERRTVTHFTTADGLAQNEIQAAYRDRHGALWFGTMNGVSRLVPEDDEGGPPPVFIGGVSVGGTPRVLSAVGEREVGRFEVPAEGGGVRIEYFATDFTPGRRELFQYRLRGAGDGWSAPTGRDAVEYAALSPGEYRFEVRTHDGMAASPGLAAVAFVVRPPVWRRAWFLSLLAALAALLAYRFHRSRVQRALDLERIRTRIATDLHDDIGSSLSQIAIWSEVAARQSGEPALKERLGGMAASCREAVDAMSDIVWAVNPAHDRLGDLTHRMRRFASDVFTAREIAFRFEASLPEDRPLSGDVRRHVLLVFKEAVHNAARHSGCSVAEAGVAIANDSLRVWLRDDGKGFDPDARGGGHGLGSMRARAADLGGTLDVTSAAGQGTTVSLTVALHGTGTPMRRRTLPGGRLARIRRPLL